MVFGYIYQNSIDILDSSEFFVLFQYNDSLIPIGNIGRFIYIYMDLL